MGSEIISDATERGFRIGHANFRIHRPTDPVITTDENSIVILKPPAFLKKYDRVFTNLPSTNVIEVGIAEGGSLIYFALAFPHLRFLGIDLREPNQHVLKHIDRLGLGKRISINYQVEQSHKARIHEIIEREFGNEPIGAVIDDASHFYTESRGTFEGTFGLISPNGTYCLEDWSWAHEPGPAQSTMWWDKPALTNLLFQMIMAQPSQPGLFDEITIDRNVAFIKRGNAPRMRDFDLASLVLNRGRQHPHI